MDKEIIKFLNAKASQLEQDKLENALEDSSTKQKYEDYLKVHYASTLVMNTYNVENAKHKLSFEINKQTKFKRKKIIIRLSVAASVLLFLGLMIFNRFQKTVKNNPSEISQTVIKPGSKKAILTLENGEDISLDKKHKFKDNRVKSNGEALVYKQAKTSAMRNPKYNYLTIPRGGQFFVQLSDGTKVWLNADTKMKYPVAFLDNQPRKVELIYGEAYFEVSPSTKNKGKAFYVVSNSQTIKVLGTKFNIKMYKNADEIKTTLKEGKVLVENESNHVFLHPNEQSRIIKGTSGFDVKLVDVNHEMSWLDDTFSFKSETFSEIMKQFERWYDVTIVFEDKAKQNLVFTGVLQRTKNIEDLLMIFKETNENEITFKINGKIITIK